MPKIDYCIEISHGLSYYVSSVFVKHIFIEACQEQDD